MSKTLTVTLYKSEIKHMVKSSAHFKGLSIANGNNFEQISNLELENELAQDDMITQWMDGAFAELQNKVSQYLASTTAASTSNNIQKLTEGTGNTTYVLTLNMPNNFNDSVKDTIAAASHKYIANSTISNWLFINLPAEAPTYVALADNAILTIREALSKRVAPTRTVPVV